LVVAVTEKARRLEAVNPAGARAGVRWEDSDYLAGETGRVSDRIEAAEDDRNLDAADRKIKKTDSEP
jgi:hypothetical protein